MKNRMFTLFEATIYYAIYLLSGIAGNILAIAVAAVITGIEYVSNNMLADETEFFSDILSIVNSEPALSILLANLAVIFMYHFAFRNRKKNLSVYIGAKRASLRGMIFALMAGFTAQGAISAVLDRLKSSVELIGEYEQQIAWMQEGNPLLLIIVVLVVAPIVEEVVFRGVLISSLQKVITPIGALLLTSILFGAAHGNPVQGVYSFVLGVLLAFVRIRSGSLWHAVAMHIAFNAANIFAVFGMSAAVFPLWCSIPLSLVFVLLASGRSAAGDEQS